jgi:hypothetical protein
MQASQGARQRRRALPAVHVSMSVVLVGQATSPRCGDGRGAAVATRMHAPQQAAFLEASCRFRRIAQSWRPAPAST